MGNRTTDKRARVTLEPAEDTAPSAGLVPVAQRRTIAVGDAKTIVVHPRISTPYKAMIWFSFGLNVVLLLILFGAGLFALNFYRETQSQLQAGLDMNTPAGQRLQELRQNPDEALGTARYGMGQLMSSIEGLQSAHIRSNIPIDQQIPINLEVPVNQQTAVRTTAAVPMVVPARFTLPGGGGQINGSVALSLPQGLELPVTLNLSIPISSTIPVKLNVPVDIAIQDTELADDVNRLHTLVEPTAKLIKAR